MIVARAGRRLTMRQGDREVAGEPSGEVAVMGPSAVDEASAAILAALGGYCLGDRQDGRGWVCPPDGGPWDIEHRWYFHREGRPITHVHE